MRRNTNSSECRFSRLTTGKASHNGEFASSPEVLQPLAEWVRPKRLAGRPKWLLPPVSGQCPRQLAPRDQYELLVFQEALELGVADHVEVSLAPRRPITRMTRRCSAQFIVVESKVNDQLIGTRRQGR